MKDTESLISQYADDTFLVIDGCETSLRETLICFENFYFKASGLKINNSKTRVVWVGNKRYSNQILCPDFKNIKKLATQKAHPSWEGNRDKNTCTSKTYSFTYLTAKFKTITV